MANFKHDKIFWLHRLPKWLSIKTKKQILVKADNFLTKAVSMRQSQKVQDFLVGEITCMVLEITDLRYYLPNFSCRLFISWFRVSSSVFFSSCSAWTRDFRNIFSLLSELSMCSLATLAWMISSLYFSNRSCSSWKIRTYLLIYWKYKNLFFSNNSILFNLTNVYDMYAWGCAIIYRYLFSVRL